MKVNQSLVRTLKLLLPVALAAAPALAQDDLKHWATVGGSSANLHYSALDQINRGNVAQLRIAWTFDSKDAYPNSDTQCNPIIVGKVMYVTTASLRVAALDAATGKQIWLSASVGDRAPNPNRGVTYWSDGTLARILVTAGYELFSLDAATGKPAPEFGKQGKVDLRAAFDRPVEDVSLTVTSPGVIYKDLLILGSSVSENLPATAGDIRAYDVHTGAVRWTFHTIPRPGEFGYETWPPDAWKTTGAANNWAGMAVDQTRGLVYIPTGSAAFDFYGADRHGDDLFANTLLCLDAATGKRKWHFQAIRHDAWDLDFPASPTLISVRHDGQLIDAVAQAGKAGYLYVLNRETGESLFPMKERPVPVSPTDGELLATSEPVPVKPEPFVRQEFNPDMVTRRTDAAHQAVLDQIKRLDYGSLFQPATTKGAIFFPGLAGGAEWGGGAYDPQTHLYYINANELGWIVRLVPSQSLQPLTKASAIYRARCASCHGPDMKGAPPEYPALDQVAQRLNASQISTILHKGGGRMPSFASLGEPAIAAMQDLLLNKHDTDVQVQRSAKTSSPLKYSVEAYRKFLDPDGYPATTPPWGTLSAINLDTGNYVWKKPFGEYPELVAQGMKDTGSENHGGPVATAGGLLFIGATHYDKKFHAYDKETGKLLWEMVLPFAANATPSVYELGGKEYVVVAAGGGRDRPSSGLYIAFALP